MTDNFREVYGFATSGADAQANAKAKAAKIKRAKKSVEITMAGTSGIIAGMVVNLEGFRDGINGRYKIVTVRNSMSRSGWTTSLTGEAF